MKILHISPSAPYNDYWGYQENILPKYHKKLGHDVTLIITNLTQKDGKWVETDCADYVLNDGVRVIRKSKKKYFSKIYSSLCSRLDIYKELVELRPDFIFYHGLVSTTIFDVIKYKKKINPNCVIVQDNHLDYNIGFKYKGVKRLLIKTFYWILNRRSIRYVDRVFGVTPWRKKYAQDFFGIPAEKTGVLIMGADDEKIDFENRETIRKSIRDKYSIKDDDFLIVTGGKIDSKKKIHLLMEACSGLPRVTLIVFGSVQDDVKKSFYDILGSSDNIYYIGWIDADSVYDYFFAADLAFFPGQHSVLWEQACASKIPCIFEKWEGMDHVNNGGNSAFIEDVTVESLKERVLSLVNTPEYEKMKAAAESDKTDIYLYSNIAKKSIEIAEK